MTLLFTCISYVVDARKMMLHSLTSWKQRLTSAKCQNDIGMAPDSVTAPPSDLMQNKSLNLTIGYIARSVRINIISPLYKFCKNNTYGMCLKILNTLFYTILAKFCFFEHLLLKILSGITNSVDPDQTALSGAV